MVTVYHGFVALITNETMDVGITLEISRIKDFVEKTDANGRSSQEQYVLLV